MTESTNTQPKKNGMGTMIGLICGAGVYFVGNALYPATSSFASDRGPRMITMMTIAAVTAGVVTFVISLVSGKKA